MNIINLRDFLPKNIGLHKSAKSMVDYLNSKWSDEPVRKTNVIPFPKRSSTDNPTLDNTPCNSNN